MTCPNCNCDTCSRDRRRSIEAAVERIKNMTPEEVFRLSVKTGIHNEDGTLTAHYGGVDK